MTYKGGAPYPAPGAILRGEPKEGEVIAYKAISEISDAEKLDCCREFFKCGNMSEVSRNHNIRPSHLKDLSRTAWWRTEIQNLDREVAIQMKVRLTALMGKTLDELEERLENGDEKLDKDGCVHNLKVPARDLASIANMLFDKKAMLEDRATGVMTNETKRLLDLAMALKAKDVSAKEVAGANVIEGESVESQSE